MSKRRQAVFVALVASVASAVGMGALPTAGAAIGDDGTGVDHIVVIYEENHSFDNLYGGWGAVNGQAVDGLAAADPAHTTQVAQDGTPYTCLPQNDVNLAAKAAGCTQPTSSPAGSGFANGP